MSKSSQYTAVKVKTPPSNTFDLSHDRKFSMNMGKLVPHLLMEVLPGDKISINSNHLIRLAPMLAPMMHMVDVYQHFWYCPNRLVWSNWQDFITAGPDGSSAPVFPYVEHQTYDPSTIPDYLGLPTGIHDESTHVSAIPFAIYGKIWNEFYRDQNLQIELDVDLVDGDNTALIFTNGLEGVPFNRAWTQDYFTSCLPFPQKGPAVTLPLGTTADVMYNPQSAAGIGSVVRDATTFNPLGPTPLFADNSPTGEFATAASLGASLHMDNSQQLQVDLSSALSASINDLRLSFAIQGWLELNARTGTRYTEYLRAHWDSYAGDSTLQRPEYLGGSKAPIVVSEVLQTSATETETPQGNMAGHGISTSNAHSFNYHCKEHGYVMGIISVMPKPAYFQGLHKSWRRFDKFDYYEPMFANLGEQAVLNSEIYFQDNGTDDAVFGYQARWAEYKDMPSTLHGDFKTTNLFWTMAREFSALPSLNSNFIQCDATQRIFAVQGADLDHLWCHVYHSIRAQRPMPVYGVPSLL